MASEVTVSSTQGLTRVITEVVELLENHKEAKITAINLAIPSAVNLVELLKHKIKGLYQQNSFEKVANSNKTRVVFLLSLKPLESSHKGYQSPIAESEVQEKSFAELKKPPPQTFRPQEERKTEGSRPPRTGQRPPQNRTDDSKPQTREPREENRENNRETRGRGRGNRGQRGSRRGRGRGGRDGRGPRRGGRGGYRGDNRREPGMEKYELVRTRERTERQKNELFVGTNGNPIFSVKDGLRLFKKDGLQTIVIKASGQAIPKAVRVAEDIRKREPGLHQISLNTKKTVQDRYKPLEEGLDEVVKSRVLEGLEITLSKSALDKNDPGYQPPLASDKVVNLTLDEVEKL